MGDILNFPKNSFVPRNEDTFQPTHKNFQGEEYQVICISSDAQSEAKIVTFRGKSGKLWSTTLEVFEGYQRDGRKNFVKLQKCLPNLSSK